MTPAPTNPAGSGPAGPKPRRVRLVQLALLSAVVLLLAAGLRRGSSGATPIGEVAQGLGGLLGIGPGLEGSAQWTLELRLWRGLTAAGVGASLALAGALLQGLYRNGLASPSVLGVTSGAVFGGTLAILARSSVGTTDLHAAWVLWLVPCAAFAGACAVAASLFYLASGGGRVSVPLLLLAGVAMNTCLGALVVVVQNLAMEDFGLTRSLMDWTFGNLNDRHAGHAIMVAVGLFSSLACVPFLSAELDLFAGGEADARTLGVPVERVKLLAILAVCLSTACAVAAVGAVAFVGLVVPHGVRALVGRGHRAVLWTAPLAGAALLLAVDVGQLAAFGRRPLGPGVAMSVVGGPLFLMLLVRQRRRIGAW